MTPDRILLIGTSRGLGLALTEAYLERGANVMATVRGDTPTPLGELASRTDGRLEVEHVDIEFPDSITGLAQRLAGRTFDVLFVVAGVTHAVEQTAANIDTETFNWVMVTNALAPMRVIEALEDRVSPAGTIAVMSSGQGSISNNNGGGWEIYRACKAALNQLMRSYAVRTSANGRSLVLMAPGWVRTDLGGPNARLTLAETVPGIIATLDQKRDRPGLEYLDYQGRTIPW